MQTEAALSKAWADFSSNGMPGYPLLSRYSSNFGVSLNGTMVGETPAIVQARKTPISGIPEFLSRLK